MQAYYYYIVDTDGNIVTEGIIRNAEDTIYPQQDTGIDELPYECEAHHFEAENYILKGWYIELDRDDAKRMRRAY